MRPPIAFGPKLVATVAAVAAAAAVAASCNPMRSAAFAVTPQRAAAAPAPAGDSAGRAVFASVARIAAGHGLTPLDPRDAHGNNVEGWRECYGRGSLVLCGKLLRGAAHFRLWQMGRLSADAEQLRRDLTRSLEEQFGEGSVRDCEWQRAADPHDSGCSPFLSPDGA